MDIRSIDEIYSGLMDSYYEQTGFDMLDSCELAVRFKAAAAQINALYSYMDWVRRQCFPQTASGDALDMHAQMRGLERKSAEAAGGEIRFYIPAALAEDLSIPSGTVCLNSGAVRFATTAEAVITAGALYAQAPAVACEAGSAGNVSAGTVCYMSSPPAGVGSCVNPAAFTGGSDAESDDELRARVLATYTSLTNGGNAAYYEAAVLGTEGVEAVRVLPRRRGAGTVDVVVSAPGGMPSQALLQSIEAELDAVREICVDVSVLAPEKVDVVVEAAVEAESGYDAEELTARVADAVSAWFDGSLLGCDVLRVKLCDIIYGVEGVRNYSLSYPAEDIKVAQDALPVLSSVSISEA